MPLPRSSGLRRSVASSARAGKSGAKPRPSRTAPPAATGKLEATARVPRPPPTAARATAAVGAAPKRSTEPERIRRATMTLIAKTVKTLTAPVRPLGGEAAFFQGDDEEGDDQPLAGPGDQRGGAGAGDQFQQVQRVARRALAGWTSMRRGAGLHRAGGAGEAEDAAADPERRVAAERDQRLADLRAGGEADPDADAEDAEGAAALLGRHQGDDPGHQRGVGGGAGEAADDAARGAGVDARGDHQDDQPDREGDAADAR